MALTKISTGGVKDDAASQAKIADEAVDEARLQVSNAGSNGQFLQKQSGNTGGLTWATVTVPDSDKIEEGNTSVETIDTGSDGYVKITTEGTERVRVIADGKVGIGTGAPEELLHIKAASAPAIQLEAYSGGPYKSLIKMGGNDTEIRGSSGNIEFFTGNDDGDSSTEKLRIGSAGQLGIGGATYGSSGQVLTSGGASAAPTWADAGGGVDSDAQRNTIAGTNAGDSFTGTDATDNTLFGYDAGTAITTADRNTGFGVYALKTVSTDGFYNTGIGYSALKGLTTADSCTAVGDWALGSVTTGDYNTGVGSGAGSALTTGNQNTYMGKGAGQTASTSSENTGLGYEALANCNGATNTAVGHRALYECTSGTLNVAVGHAALKEVTTASGNVATGTYAGLRITTGSYNSAYGHNTMIQNETGEGNTAFGVNAAYNTTADYNTAVGYQAGYDLTSGFNNLCLGKTAGRNGSPSGNITTGSNNIVLGDDNISDFYCADTSISSSDKRDKTDVTDFTHGLKWINQLKPVTYRWDKRTWYNEYNEDGSLKTEGTPDGSKKRAKQHIGFLAQDVLAVEQADGFASKKDDMLVVNLNEDDTAYGLKYERLVPVLVNAIKELSAKVETLETKVAALESA